MQSYKTTFSQVTLTTLISVIRHRKPSRDLLCKKVATAKPFI